MVQQQQTCGGLSGCVLINAKSYIAAIHEEWPMAQPRRGRVNDWPSRVERDPDAIDRRGDHREVQAAQLRGIAAVELAEFAVGTGGQLHLGPGLASVV